MEKEKKKNPILTICALFVSCEKNAIKHLISILYLSSVHGLLVN